MGGMQWQTEEMVAIRVCSIFEGRSASLWQVLRRTQASESNSSSLLRNPLMKRGSLAQVPEFREPVKAVKLRRQHSSFDAATSVFPARL